MKPEAILFCESPIVRARRKRKRHDRVKKLAKASTFQLKSVRWQILAAIVLAVLVVLVYFIHRKSVTRLFYQTILRNGHHWHHEVGLLSHLRWNWHFACRLCCELIMTHNIIDLWNGMVLRNDRNRLWHEFRNMLRMMHQAPVRIKLVSLLHTAHSVKHHNVFHKSMVVRPAAHRIK